MFVFFVVVVCFFAFIVFFFFFFLFFAIFLFYLKKKHFSFFIKYVLASPVWKLLYAPPRFLGHATALPKHL